MQPITTSNSIADEGSADRDPLAGRSATILVVDDEPLARQTLSDLLEAQDYRVLTASRGEEVFPALAEVELVLLDAMLPGQDGWSICRQIKETVDPLLPVIMVTARTAPDDIVRTFNAGADDYVAKPFHIGELTARIETRLRVRRAEQALQKANAQLAELATQNYKLYEQARRDAEERANLLRELDHRVRNNLSVIMGLVSMERNRRPPRPTSEALASLENRLRSFLLVYEALRRQSYRGVPIREIAERLAQRLRNTIDVESRIGLQVVGGSAALEERQGFALALVLNELITNALRHAFPDERSGTLTIEIREAEDEVRIEVRDDGVGIRPDQACALGSGRSIIDALVSSDLGGRIEYTSNGKGTRVEVSFPPATAVAAAGAV